MADPVLVPCGVRLRSQIDALNPTRDRSSDGWIADAAHRLTSSDHNADETGNVPIRDPDRVNEVHAIDVDETGPWPVDGTGRRWSVMTMVRQLIEDCRAGRERRIRYVIYERTIWSASWGWTAREYVGANPHDKHAHISFSYDAAHEADNRSFNIGFAEVDLDATQARQLRELHESLINTRHTWAGGRNAVRLLEDLAYAFLYGLPGTDTTWLARTLRVLGEAAGLDATELERIRGAVGTQLTTELLAALRAELSELPSEVIEAATERAVRHVLGSVDETP